MITTQEREIDGNVYSVTQLPAMRGLKLFSRLGKLFGPAIGQALATVDTKSLGTADIGALGAVLGTLFEKVTEDELEKLTKDLLQQALIDNTALMPQFDIRMQGKTLTIFKLLAFALEVNYGSFTDVLRGLAPAGQVPARSESNSKASNT